MYHIRCVPVVSSIMALFEPLPLKLVEDLNTTWYLPMDMRDCQKHWNEWL